MDMDVLHTRCAGIDLSKRDAKVCVRTPPTGRKRKPVEDKTTWSSMPRSVLQLRDYLIAEKVTCVIMEATSDYWKPFYYVLEGGPYELLLVNAQHAKNVPGRKTDMSDAAWLATLGAYGLLRASYVPPPNIRILRDLTRMRTTFTRARASDVQRLEKILEDAGIKLSVVASDITGASGRRILTAMARGQRDPRTLAELSLKQLRNKIDLLVEALDSPNFNSHHGFQVEMMLERIDTHDAHIEKVTARIEEAMTPFRPLRELICTIPNISTRTADVIIAEIGTDMSVFPTPEHLTSWAGVCPGHHESAGHNKSAKTRPGNRHLKGALGTAAMSIARHDGTFLHAKYVHLVRTRGAPKAIVALQRNLLVIIWNMLTNQTVYTDPGPSYHTQRHPNLARNNALRKLNDLGYTVTLEPRTA